MSILASAPTPQRLEERLLADLTHAQRQAVTHQQGPLLILAGAGTGKTTVITRRIAWLLATKQARPEEILALTFTDKAAAEMEERVDVLVPYGYTDIAISTFHAFGDRLLREHAVEAGLSPEARVLSRAEQVVFLRQHLFALPLNRLRPLVEPDRYLEALATVIARAKDEAVTPEEFLALAAAHEAAAKAAPEEARLKVEAELTREMAACYEAYLRLLREAKVLDFGGQILLTIWLFEQHPELLERLRLRYRYILVDEFQDTNFAQFRLLQLLASPTASIAVVADDDQSIYKWRGAAISNVLKFLEHYQDVRRVVLTENFRSSQAILDCAYRLIRFNDPDRLEVTEQIDKRLIAMSPRTAVEPKPAVFDTVSSEADWVATQIQQQLASGRRRPGDFAILVRTNREADLFLRALNVCGIPWQFSGASGLFARDEVKMLVSCLRILADPEDSLSAYHVLSSSLYNCPMEDLVACLARANRTNQGLQAVLKEALAGRPEGPALSEEGRRQIEAFSSDVKRLCELSRTHSPGQLLYRWLTDTGWLKRHAALERAEDADRLQSVARFFDQLYRFEGLLGNRLPELMRSLEWFQALGESNGEEFDPLANDRVRVLTIHKAKGLEFPVVFMVGLVQGRFPTPLRREALELPEPLLKDLLPSGDYHLQEERRLFYVGMTRAKEELYLTAAHDYGGKTVRKVSQFVLEALNLSAPSPPAIPSVEERLSRARPPASEASPERGRGTAALPEPLRLDAHGAYDYLTCPLKFRYSHVLRIPIMRYPSIIYGATLHKAVELFFKRQMKGQPMSEAELLDAFEQAWSSEGFLTREHEEQRLARGREVLRAFFAAQQRNPEQPTLIEEKFTFQLDDFLVAGRWDRVDCRGDEAVIIDYKSSEVTKPREADKRVRESLQMAVYALAWKTLHGILPARLELRFLETGLVGNATFTDEDLQETCRQLREVARGVRALDFHPQPQEYACRWCAYQSICPFSAV
ncbi:MAG: ATP-dependent helicase [Candidatus Omnitrophica bacterium]|nr:ATP-dependent helicase [Candidatus Omnitrophota bacterium]